MSAPTVTPRDLERLLLEIYLDGLVLRVRALRTKLDVALVLPHVALRAQAGTLHEPESIFIHGHSSWMATGSLCPCSVSISMIGMALLALANHNTCSRALRFT